MKSTPKVHPMIFNADMVRELLEGRKTQTRRPVKRQPFASCFLQQWAFPQNKEDVENRGGFLFPNGKERVLSLSGFSVGDLIYVRETFRCNGWATDVATIFYKASERKSYTEMHKLFPIKNKKPLEISNTWTPSVHMPRWASRLTLKVTGVRVERVQDISTQDAKAEGFGLPPVEGMSFAIGARTNFRITWESIYGESWNRNDWVWVIDFEVIRQNVDEYLAEA